MEKVRYGRFAYSKVSELCEKIFASYGFGADEASNITKVLLKADLFGIESHGVQRMIRYHNGIKNGEVDICATPVIVHETQVSATVDANRAMGQLAGMWAMRLAIQKAKAAGIGLVAVRNSNHYGIAGFYSLMAAEEDLIGVCMTNTESILVPTFASKGVLGTNPIALAMPADPTPFSFDAATTVVPRGKLEVYAKREEPLPHGWGLDAQGRDSVSAPEVLGNIISKVGGGIAPLGGSGEINGGHKGYGFALICELFTSMMAGGLASDRCATVTSHCFWAIDYGIFGDKNEIKRNFSEFLDVLRNAPKAHGQSRVFIHGEKEFESETHNFAQGIPINEKTFRELHDIAHDAGIDASIYIGADMM